MSETWSIGASMGIDFSLSMPLTMALAKGRGYIAANCDT